MIIKQANQIDSHEIILLDSNYAPSSLEISVGETVTWTNLDSVRHTITFEDEKQISSTPLSQNETYSYLFNVPGTYNYFCRFANKMRGKIIVK